MTSFLEPVFLNEKMVLNCAAYLWKGVALETELTEKTEHNKGGTISFGIPFLKSLLSPITMAGELKKGSMEENKYARRYTVGGLHMAVLDELRSRKMIETVNPSDLLSSNASYIDIQAVLRPIDYYALIRTLKTILPVVTQIIRDFGDKFIPRQQGGNDPSKHSKHSQSPTLSLAERYETSLTTLLESLESDYLTSKQLEMVMWSGGAPDTPLGVVDLDMSDADPAEVKAKLTGGNFHIIGKIVNKLGNSESMNLMQRSVLSSGLEVINKLMTLPELKEAGNNWVTAIEKARPMTEKLISPTIQGPLIRVAAMSVCI